MSLKDMLELKKKFASASTPDPKEMRGNYEVRLVTGILPDVRFFKHRKIMPDDVAIENNGQGGYNEFLGKIRIGSFKISVVDSLLGDGQKVLKVNYNRPGNSFLVRPLNDELKKLGEGYYLGRGVFVFGKFAFNSFYFSLKKEA